MNLKEIKEIAAERGVKAGKMKKSELVRAIQETEGNPACFDTGRSTTCAENACLWKQDCS